MPLPAHLIPKAHACATAINVLLAVNKLSPLSEAAAVELCEKAYKHSEDNIKLPSDHKLAVKWLPKHQTFEWRIVSKDGPLTSPAATADFTRVYQEVLSITGVDPYVAMETARKHGWGVIYSRAAAVKILFDGKFTYLDKELTTSAICTSTLLNPDCPFTTVTIEAGGILTVDTEDLGLPLGKYRSVEGVSVQPFTSEMLSMGLCAAANHNYLVPA